MSQDQQVDQEVLSQDHQVDQEVLSQDQEVLNQDQQILSQDQEDEGTLKKIWVKFKQVYSQIHKLKTNESKTKSFVWNQQVFSKDQ